MALTKKHFEQIAREIKSQVEAARTARIDSDDKRFFDGAITALNIYATSFCDIARSDNEHFDSSRFLRACGF